MKDTIKMMKFIRQGRSRKKQKLYKLAFGVAFDWTIAIYTGFFLFMVLFIFYDVMKQMEALFLEYQDIVDPFLPLMIFGLVIGMLIQSFHFPGVKVTSAEWKLTSLPFQIDRIWRYQFFRELCKRFVIISIIFSFIFLITPLSNLFILKWYLLITVVSLLTILPQWFFYQIDGFRKLFIYLTGIFSLALIRILFLFVEEPTIFLYVFILLLVLVNSWMWKRKLIDVNWGKVIEKSDEKEWNMFFINRMSRMDQVKKPRKHYFVQSLFKSKKARLPFPYQEPSILMRKLWLRSIRQEMEGLRTTIFSIIACVIILSLRGPLLQGIGIMLSVFMFVQMMVSYFGEIFKDKMIHSLPWNMATMTKSFWLILKWLSIAVLTVITSVMIIVQGLSLLLVVQLVFVYVSLFFLLDRKLEERVKHLNEKWYVPNPIEQIMSILTYVTLTACIYYPIVMVFLVVIIMYWIIKKHYFPLLID
ncbi:ABC transporter permease [Gracilibacillus massiliensis]|uniref:ABC transporter permease n=1 Tax=Gracilibacillus massiliensis TaxID=1564956 RepID=UPI00071D108B|nr:ABC transporter permease [Gracilibacillus massiliensis]